MKKSFVLLFMAALAVSAFAQTPGLSIGSWNEAVASINSPNIFSIYSEIYIAYKGRDVGINTTLAGGISWTGLVTDGKLVPTPKASPTNWWDLIQDAMVWYRPYPFLKAMAGKLFETGDAVLSSYVDYRKFSTYMANQEPGIMASVYPTRELTVSAFVPFTQFYATQLEINAAFSARYVIPKLLNVVASFRFRNYEFAAGVDLRIIEDLVLKAGLIIRDDSAPNYHSPTGEKAAGLFFSGGRKFGLLNLGVDADIKFIPTLGAGAKAMVEYGLGKYIAGFKLAVFYNDLWFWGSTWTDTFSKAAAGFIPALYVRRDFQNGSVSAAFQVQTDLKILDWSIPITFRYFF